MVRFVTPLALALILLISCDTAVNPPVPAPPEGIAVYSVVKAQDSTQYALVTKPRRADEPRLQYLQDASVHIAGEPLTVVPEDSLDAYDGRPLLSRPGGDNANYVTDALEIPPGERVRLRVSRGEHEVTGTLRVPGDFTATVDSMTIRWQPSTGAQTYTLRVRRYNGMGNVEWEYVTTTSDTVATVPSATDHGAFQPGSHGIIITAVDSNLARYADPGTRRAGLEGGYGVFGAITQAKGTVPLPATDRTERRGPDLAR